MKTLLLADLEGFSHQELVEHVMSSYQTDSSDVVGYDFLIAYESVGSWGCDSASFFLLKAKDSDQLFEVHGSHCSCYGFEEQWIVEETSIEYLKSDKFHFYGGGYDGSISENQQLVSQYLAAL
jgi:hypothetical protein